MTLLLHFQGFGLPFLVLPLRAMSDYGLNNELEEGDYYLSPDGYRVFTEQYHLKRGYCCKNGCRHCPYGFNKKRKI